MKAGRQILVDTVVAVAAILVLILLTVAGLTRARQAAQSLSCDDNLLHVGRMLHAYTQINSGFIPPAQVREHSKVNGRSGWYTYADALIECNLGIAPVAPTLADLRQQKAIAGAYRRWFRCPAATVPAAQPFSTSYACNPNGFWVMNSAQGSQTAGQNPGTLLDRLRDMPRPAEVIAVGDANQDDRGKSQAAFDWLRYGRLDDSFEPTKIIPVGGPGGRGNQDGMRAIGPGNSGLRYRHVGNVLGTGSANVLYFDGHVGQVKVNTLRQMDVAASY